MMDWTDRHCRYFMRLLSPSVSLYTEMITAAAIYHGDKQRLLRFDASEHPLAIQLGGSDPDLMTAAAIDAADPATAPRDDILGNLRGARPDIGCFEKKP